MLERDTGALLTDADIAQTVDAIARVQLAGGCIPWFPGGHADPWDHIEAAMALTVGGRLREAENAYRWCARTQNADGSWPAKFDDKQSIDQTLDANFTAYIATGVWHHWLATADAFFLRALWPVVDRAIEFVLELQDEAGAIRWARDRDYRPWPAALITSSSSIYLSLRCALGLAVAVGVDRPDWELAIPQLASAITSEPHRFENKDRYSMDWYYPLLAGVIGKAQERDHLAENWDRFVVEGRGVRCVADRPWITTAETCELVLALDRMGMSHEARAIFEWVQYLRAEDGAYWTGATFPDGRVWPVEKATWSSAAVVLAADTLAGTSPTSGLFRGDGLPAPVRLARPVGDAL